VVKVLGCRKVKVLGCRKVKVLGCRKVSPKDYPPQMMVYQW
jgi:hypothetical protein